MKIISLFSFSILFTLFNFSVRAEGTKTLRPTEADFGSLHISNRDFFTRFGQYGASEAQQIKIRIGKSGEKIFFGFNNHFEGNPAFVPNIPFRILSPKGIEVYNSLMPPQGQPGHINTYEQAVAGPSQLGNLDGYDALSLEALETGDYILEFNISDIGNEQLQLHLFDVTVASNDLIPQPGRLHSQGWQISTEAFSNPFNGKVYPYNRKGVVYEVYFNEMKPFTFIIFFNSKGTANTGNTILDRQSKIKFNTFPEYEVFLNPPDPRFYPSEKKDITFSSDSKNNDCSSGDYCLNFTSNAEGVLDGFIDLDGNGKEEASDIRFSEEYKIPGTKCISWNGKDKNGNAVDYNNIKIYSSFGYGVTHLPLFDVEDNINGFKVRIVSPVDSPVKLFWDDSQISAGIASDGKVNLEGCNDEDGCHRWKNRGDNSNPESINTWWYTTLLYDTLVFSAPENPPVNLSFHSERLSQNDTIVCQGEELKIFIHNDGNHYDPEKFNYTWFLNESSIDAEEREFSNNYNLNSEVVISSSLKSNPVCVSYDTLRIKTVAPVNLSAIITPGGCLQPLGSIETSLLSGPTEAVFTWKEFPGTTNKKLEQLPDGTYHLLVEDPAFPGTCSLDTFFTIVNGGKDSIVTDFSYKNTNGSGTFWEGDEVQFTPVAEMPLTTTMWNIEKKEISTQENPRYTFDSAGVYEVSLLVTGSNGCPGKVTKYISIIKRFPCEAVLPNAFSPNGDGQNDNIGILGKVVSMDLIIFNRWGEAIFRSLSQEDRWDGTYRNVLSPIGVYPYLLVYECPDINGILVENKKVGEITLVR